jgi:hypothetical protein
MDNMSKGMDELITFVRARLDEDERRYLTLQQQHETHTAEARLIRSLLNQVNGTRQLLDHVEQHTSPAATTPSEFTWEGMARKAAQQYAGHPDYRNEWTTTEPS